MIYPPNQTYQFYPHLSLPRKCNCNITFYYHLNVLIGRICCTSSFNCSGNSTDNRTDRNNTFCGPADFNIDVYHNERMVGELFTVLTSISICKQLFIKLHLCIKEGVVLDVLPTYSTSMKNLRLNCPPRNI